jgi:hypothetical protein
VGPFGGSPSGRSLRLLLLALFVGLVGWFVAMRLGAGGPNARSDSTTSTFNTYTAGGFSVAVPGDLADVQRNGDAMEFHGASTDRSARFENGTASGPLAEWLAAHYAQDAAEAEKNHVAQPLATETAYVFPRSSHTWRQDADYYVVSWDSADGIDHYKAVVAVAGDAGLRWAEIDLDTPLSTAIGCKHGLEYMLDTLLVSAGIKTEARDPGCRN